MKLLRFLGLVLLFIFALSIYTLTLRGVSGNVKSSDLKNNLEKTTKPFELSPERGRFVLTMSLGDNKSFALSKELAEAGRPDVGYYKGKLYVFFAPGISVMALPFYDFGKSIGYSQAATFFMIALFASLNLVVIFLISRNIFRLQTWGALLASLIFGFSSTAWSYAITLYQHQVTVFFILSGYYAVWKYRQRTTFSWLGAVWVWFCFGAAIAIDYPNIFLMLPVMIYLALSAFDVEKSKETIRIKFRFSVVFTSVLFIALIGLHGYYNQVHFGDWKKLSGSLVNYDDVKKQNLKTKQGQDKIELIANKKTPTSFFTEENLPHSNFTLLFSVDRGLFFYMPIFALALLGMWQIRRRITTEIAVLLGLVVANIFLYSSWGDPWGGWAYGTRYLIPTMAYLSIFTALFISSGRHFLKAIAALPLFAFSIAIALLGALTTNAVPPKIEADYYHWKYNFLFNLDFLKNSDSGSLIYNTFFANSVSLTEYFLYIYAVVMALIIVVLFVLPWFNKDESKD